MPGRHDKSRYLADVTISQFADAKEPSGRFAKRASNCRHSALYQQASADIDDIDNDDGDDLDDFDEFDDLDESSQLGGRKRRQLAETKTSANAGTVYPALLWQLLSDYIHPESVSTFARLCRDARRATRRRSFWRRLYLRWAWGPAAEADSSAPHELHRASILACHLGVRPRVIRALHRWYFNGLKCGWESSYNWPDFVSQKKLRFLRFAVLAEQRRLLLLFSRGPAPPPPKPPPDSWELEAANEDRSNVDMIDRHRCPTEGQWLLVAELDACGLSPHCIEELLALDSRCVLIGLDCLTGAVGGGGAVGKLAACGLSSSGRWCELVFRLTARCETRSIGFACSATPRLLPWWRPGFLPALRSAQCDGGPEASDELAGW